jgi:hypothetical protein
MYGTSGQRSTQPIAPPKCPCSHLLQSSAPQLPLFVTGHNKASCLSALQQLNVLLKYNSLPNPLISPIAGQSCIEGSAFSTSTLVDSFNWLAMPPLHTILMPAYQALASAKVQIT